MLKPRFLILVACALFVCSLAFADKEKALSLTGRVVDVQVSGDATIVVVMRGTDTGVEKGWRARFREGTTTKLLEGGEAILIRVDHRTTVLKTTLKLEQVRANRIVQFDPP